MKQTAIRLILVFALAGIVIFAEPGQSANLSAAKLFPSGAVIYLQVEDFAKTSEFWNSSEIRKRYLGSANFEQFQKSHLGIKLSERLNDFGTALGFDLSISQAINLSEKGGSLALYDIGRLEFVYVAPFSSTLFETSLLLTTPQNLKTEALGDGTRFYRTEFEVDRGRQRQQLFFTNFKGYVVAATTEILFKKTIDQIKRNGRGESLAAQPNFSRLQKALPPGPITVWIDQKKLSRDYYFKRYSNSDPSRNRLENAGAFVLDVVENKVIETRVFVPESVLSNSVIDRNLSSELLRNLPAELPFIRIRTADGKAAADAVANTLFDSGVSDSVESGKWSDNSERYQPFGSESTVPEDGDYDTAIDTFESPVSRVEPEVRRHDFKSVLEKAQPIAVAEGVRIDESSDGLFVEFNKVLICKLERISLFDENSFRLQIERELTRRLSLEDQKFEWEKSGTVHSLSVPLLGWAAGYRVEGDVLIVSNSLDLLNEQISEDVSVTRIADNLIELTSINLKQRALVFDRAFETVSNGNDTLPKNLGSLIQLLPGDSRIDVQKSIDRGLTREVVTFELPNSGDLPKQ